MLLKNNTIYDIYGGEFPVNIQAMTNPKPLALIIKASEQSKGTRTRFADPHVYDYVEQCKATGIKYGLYHFLSPNGIAEQAALFISIWNKCGGANLVPIVDVEVDLNQYYPKLDAKGKPISGTSTIGNAVWQSHVKTFIDLVAAGTGRTPMIYTNKNYWAFVMTKNLLGTLIPPTWTADYPLWVAQYPDQPDSAAAPSILPNGWSKWAIWQYSDKGRTNGFLANDLNTCSDWYAEELGGIIIPDPEPTDDPYVSAVFTKQSGEQVIWLPKV